MQVVNVKDVGALIRTLPPKSIDISKTLDFRVFYPSGGSVDLRGKFLLVPLDAPSLTPAITTDEQEAFVLDPRCVVVNFESMTMVYAPTMKQARLDLPSIEWLAKNPDWPGKLFVAQRWVLEGYAGQRSLPVGKLRQVG